jgi:hypothetical protein
LGCSPPPDTLGGGSISGSHFSIFAKFFVNCLKKKKRKKKRKKKKRKTKRKITEKISSVVNEMLYWNY